MKQYLIFDIETSGHHLEYIHNIYMAAGKREEDYFIFAVSPFFQQKANIYTWPKFDNVKMHYLENNEIKNISGNSIKYSYYYSKYIKKLAKLYDIDAIFLITIVLSIPFAALLLNTKYKLSGIIYNIYLYNWKSSSLFFKIRNILQYSFFKYFSLYHKIFILNDKGGAVTFNKIYNVNKFSYLPDPIQIIDKSNVNNLRTELNIENKNTVLLHCGALSLNKGTLDILQGIKLLSPEEKSKYTFIFAGEIKSDIRDSFYELYDMLRNQVQIIVFDRFCSYDFLGSLLLTSDIILCPYKRTAQSSGIIGYAAQFGIPVISTREGLLGKLVKKYGLGILTDDITLELSSKIETIKNCEVHSNYVATHQISDFIEKIFD